MVNRDLPWYLLLVVAFFGLLIIAVAWTGSLYVVQAVLELDL